MQTDLFAHANSLVLSQTREWRDMFGIARPHRFSIDFGDQQGMLLAEEQPESWRRFLGGMRSYTVIVQQPSGKPMLRMHSPFRFFGREMVVTSADGQPLGRTRRRFVRLARYDVYDHRGTQLFTIGRSFLKRFTFTIRRGNTQVAFIKRHWRLLHPLPSKRFESYELDFAEVHSPVERSLLLGALFFIDFQHFDESGGE